MKPTLRIYAFSALWCGAGFFIGAICQRAIDERQYYAEIRDQDERLSEALRCCAAGERVQEIAETWRVAAETCVAVSSVSTREAAVSAPVRPKVRRGLLSSLDGEENTQAVASATTRLSPGISPARTGEPTGGFSRGRVQMEASR